MTEHVDLWCLISSLHLTAMIKHLVVAARWKHHIIKTQSTELQQRVVRQFAKSTLLFTPYLQAKPPSDQTFSITCHSAQLLACFSTHTPTHIYTHRCVCSRRFSQSAPSSITRGRCYSHNSLASSALTRRPVLLPSIMARKLQFPHVSYRELWSALIEYSWYFPRYCYWGPESILLLRQTKLEGRSKAIKEEEGEKKHEWSTHSAVRSLIPIQTIWLSNLNMPHSLPFYFFCPQYEIMSINKGPYGSVGCQSHPEKLHMLLHCTPGCQFESMGDSRGPLNTRCTFLFQTDSTLITYSEDHHFHAIFPLSRGKWMSGNKWGSSQQLHINQAPSMWCRGWH